MMLTDLRSIIAWSNSGGYKFLAAVGSLGISVFAFIAVTLILVKRERPLALFDSTPSRLALRHPIVSAIVQGLIFSLFFFEDRPLAMWLGLGIAGILSGFIIGAAKAKSWKGIFGWFFAAFACFLPAPVIAIIGAIGTSTGGGDQKGMGIILLPVIILFLSPLPLLGTFYGWLALGRYRTETA